MIRPSFVAALSALACLAMAACSGSPAAAPATVAPSPSPAGDAALAAAPSLRGVCPENVVFQTNWWPEPDEGFLFQLIGPSGTIDTNTNSYSGALGATGLTAEIRAGGPAIGFQSVTSRMYQDDNILLGMVGTDDQIGASASAPTRAVLAWYARSPQILFWGNPAWNFGSVAEIRQSGATVLAFGAAPFIDVLVGKGLLDRSQVDQSYTGDPSRFVAADGAIVSQGFVTAEPYIYEHEVSGWKKPIKFLLLDQDVPIYQNSLAIRLDNLEANRACLQQLVPLLQQSALGYVRNPGPVNDLLIEYTAKIKGGTQITAAGAADAVQRMIGLGIVANGSDGVFGSYDTARVQRLIAEYGPVFESRGKPPKPGLQPSDIVTNEFLDRTRKL